MQGVLDKLLQGHVKVIAGLDEGGIEEDLVRFVKSKGEFVGVDDLAVFLRAFGAHDGNIAEPLC